MGRKSKYETCVAPYLPKIKEWYKTMTEAQISKALGISESTFTQYKNQHEELRECLQEAKTGMVEELKSKLKMKACGYPYTEYKTVTRKDENGEDVITVERYDKIAHPDTGAIHLLLKNLDENWHNDDTETLEMKKKQVEIAKKKAEAAEW